MSDFAKAFVAHEETFEQSRTQSQQLMQEGEQAVDHWLSTHTMLAIGMIPILRAWLNTLRAALKPVWLWQVYLQRHWLKRYTGVTWWHPNSFRLRLQIGYLWLLIQYARLRQWLRRLYRAAIAWSIRHQQLLIKVAIVIGVILVVYLWVRFTFYLWLRLFEGVQTFWKQVVGS